MPEPGPRPSTGITRLPRYHGPLRLPQGPRLTISDHPGWWLRTTTSVDLARCLKDRVRMLTPLPRLERTGSSIDCSPAPQRPSPSGRRVGSSEKLSRPAQGSLRFGLRTCTLVAPRTSPEAPVGDLSPQLLQWLPGRIDNSPDGTSTRWPSRPRRSLPIPLSTLTSFRAALPGSSSAQDRREPPAAPVKIGVPSQRPHPKGGSHEKRGKARRRPVPAVLRALLVQGLGH